MKEEKTREERKAKESRTEHAQAFGGCPECLGNDGFCNLGGTHWFICRAHRMRWCPGENLFAGSPDETPEYWNANWEEVSDFVEVHPVYAWGVTLTNVAKEAMEKIVKLFLPDEAADFGESNDAERENHIYHELKELKYWLERFAGGGDV